MVRSKFLIFPLSIASAKKNWWYSGESLESNPGLLGVSKNSNKDNSPCKLNVSKAVPKIAQWSAMITSKLWTLEDQLSWVWVILLALLCEVEMTKLLPWWNTSARLPIETCIKQNKNHHLLLRNPWIIPLIHLIKLYTVVNQLLRFPVHD